MRCKNLTEFRDWLLADMQTLDLQQTENLILNGSKIIDVRAPVEFAHGALPNSVCLPVLDDLERAQVGTRYKKDGQDAAIKLGHQLVSGDNLEVKLAKWKDFFEKHPDSILTCFRGGLRSQTSQKFLKESGIEIPRIKSGYKGMRTHLSHRLLDYSKSAKMKILTGNTGSGKTRLLKELAEFYPCVDLEELAQHRGSAFGKRHGRPQPAQASFENALSVEVIKAALVERPILFEDESRLIGSLHLPEPFFIKMRESKVIKLKVNLEKRIQNIFEDYVLIDEMKDPEVIDLIYDKYVAAINRITKKLGGLRASELLADLQMSRKELKENNSLESNRIWIEKLLIWYYDPMYVYSLDLRKPVIEFEGTESEVTDFLRACV